MLLRGSEEAESLRFLGKTLIPVGRHCCVSTSNLLRYNEEALVEILRKCSYLT
jgi:hypothetical protein